MIKRRSSHQCRQLEERHLIFHSTQNERSHHLAAYQSNRPLKGAPQQTGTNGRIQTEGPFDQQVAPRASSDFLFIQYSRKKKLPFHPELARSQHLPASLQLHRRAPNPTASFPIYGSLVVQNRSRKGGCTFLLAVTISEQPTESS